MKNIKRVLALLLALSLMLALAGCSASDYKEAAALYEAGDYKAASEKFAALGDYKDAAARVTDSDYMYAREMYYAGAYEAAAMAFKTLGDYEDSADMNTECVYKLAVETFNAEKYADAINLFLEVEDYEDSRDFITRARDAIMRESVLGEWKCWYDLEDQMKEAFGSDAIPGVELDPMDYFDFSGLEIVFSLVLSEDDTFTIDIDREAYDESFEAFAENMKNGLRSLVTDVYTAELSASDNTLTEYMTEYGITGIDELAVMFLGMDLDKYVDSVLGSALANAFLNEFPVTGTFVVSGTTVTFSEGSTGEYNVVLEQMEVAQNISDSLPEIALFTR